jgi:hypothetical protein
MRRATISLDSSEETAQTCYSLVYRGRSLKLETNLQIAEEGKTVYTSKETGRSTYYNDSYLTSHMFLQLHGDQLHMLAYDDTLLAFNLDLLLQFIENGMGKDYKPKKVATGVSLFDAAPNGDLYYLTRDKSLKKHRSVFEGILEAEEGEVETCLLQCHGQLLVASHRAADNIVVLRLFDSFISFRSSVWIPAKAEENSHLTSIRAVRSRDVSYFVCTSYDCCLHLLACVGNVLFNLLANAEIADLTAVWWTEGAADCIAVVGEGPRGSGLAHRYRLKFN